MRVPLTADEVEQRKRLISIVLRFTLPSTLVLGSVNVHLGSWPSAVALFGLALVCGLLEWLNAQDYYVLTSSLLVSSILLVAHINLFDGGGLQDPGLLAYPLVISLGTLLLGRRAALVWLMAAALSLWVIGSHQARLGYRAHNHPPDFHDFIVLLTLLSVSTVLIWIIIERMVERTAALRVSEERLQRANQTLEQRVAERTALARARAEQLRMLAMQLTHAEQKERQRIADILHEHFQQLLASARFSLSAMNVQDAGSQDALRRTDGVLREALEASRSLAVELSPPLLRHDGLAATLSWLGDWMLEKHGLNVEVVTTDDAPPIPAELEAFLFHAARELLFNVIKHAKVKHVKVELQVEARRVVRLSVSDEGAGFPPSAFDHEGPVGGRFGLFSIRERISLLEGGMEIRSTPGAGTCISLTVPLPVQSDAAGPAGVESEEPVAVTAGRGPLGAGVSAATVARIHVLIADDHAMMREGLSRLLRRNRIWRSSATPRTAGRP